MERVAWPAQTPLPARTIVPILCAGLILCGTAAGAELPGLDKTETKNAELVVKNLDDLVKTAGDFIKKEKGAAVWVPTQGGRKTKVAAFADVDDYKAVLENLKAKLKGKNLHSIPGLREKQPPKYSVGEPAGSKPGHPRAAYCIPHTFVKIGDAWLPCPERDIIVDKGILDPPGNNGNPIDESTPQGWKDKWTLLHVLVHEKWHERTIDEQVHLAQEENKKPGRTDAQKKKNVDHAEEQAGSPETHQEVYEAQKRILFLKWEVLRRQLKTAAAADKAKIEAEMKWILEEVGRLEDGMKKALKEKSEFEFVGCGGAADLKSGTLAIYVVMGNGYWRLDVDVAGGRAVDYRIPEALFFGTRHFEDPVAHQPSLYVTMPQRIYTGLQVQPEPCQFLKGAEQAGLVRRGPSFGSIADDVPLTDQQEGDAREPRTAEVGVVIPSDARPGETVSGSLTVDPRAYADVPALRVVSARLPLVSNAAGEPGLDRVRVDLGGGPQDAGGPLTVRVPENATRLPIHFVAQTSSGAVETRSEFVLPRQAAPPPVSPGRPGEYRTPRVCLRGTVQAIWGPLGGDAAQTRVEVDGVPALIVAETPRAVYWLLPPRAAAGPHRVVLRDEGGRSVAFEVFVMTLEMTADQLELQRGQSTRYHVRLRLGGVPPAAWRGGLVPADLIDLAALQKKAPDLRLPRQDEPGEILLVLSNASPRTITVPDMRDNRRVFHLGERDFPGGVFAHDGEIQSLADGGFVINGLAAPALAPSAGAPGNEPETVSDTFEARRIRIAYERLQQARSTYQRTMEKTTAALENGKKTAPREAVESFEKAQSESHKYWHTLVAVSAKYDTNKTDENKKALDDAEKKMKELDEAARDLMQKMIDSMSKEARKAYYDAQDAERQAGHEVNEARKELDAATTK